MMFFIVVLAALAQANAQFQWGRNEGNKYRGNVQQKEFEAIANDIIPNMQERLSSFNAPSDGRGRLSGPINSMNTEEWRNQIGKHIDSIDTQQLQSKMSEMSNKFGNMEPQEIRNKLAEMSNKFGNMEPQEIRNKLAEMSNRFGNMEPQDIRNKLAEIRNQHGNIDLQEIRKQIGNKVNARPSTEQIPQLNRGNVASVTENWANQLPINVPNFFTSTIPRGPWRTD